MLTSMGDYDEMNEVYEKVFANNEAFPARSTFAVAGLPRGALVEIECIALKTSVRESLAHPNTGMRSVGSKLKVVPTVPADLSL